jgi:hypothetical protein
MIVERDRCSRAGGIEPEAVRLRIPGEGLRRGESRMKRTIAGLAAAIGTVVVLAVPVAAVQPSQVANADGRNGGASAPGPHCHYNLTASANNNSPHGLIITGATHQAHTQTGLPTGVFQAVACSTP